MTAEERIFSIVRGGLYAKLPSLALPLGRLTCREGDVDPAGTDGEAAVFCPGASAAGIPCGKRPAGAADAASAAAPHARPPVGAAGENAGALGYGLRSGGRPRPARAFAAGAGDACGFFRPLQAAGEAGGPRPGDLRAAARAAGRADRGGTGRVLPGRPPPLGSSPRLLPRRRSRTAARRRAGRRSAGSCRTRCRRSP